MVTWTLSLLVFIPAYQPLDQRYPHSSMQSHREWVNCNSAPSTCWTLPNHVPAPIQRPADAPMRDSVAYSFQLPSLFDSSNYVDDKWELNRYFLVRTPYLEWRLLDFCETWRNLERRTWETTTRYFVTERKKFVDLRTLMLRTCALLPDIYYCCMQGGTVLHKLMVTNLFHLPHLPSRFVPPITYPSALLPLP